MGLKQVVTTATRTTSTSSTISDYNICWLLYALVDSLIWYWSLCLVVSHPLMYIYLECKIKKKLVCLRININ